MACSCTTSATLLADATYQVSQGDTFLVNVTDLTGIVEAKGSIWTALEDGTFVANFSTVISDDADAVEYRYNTGLLDPGVYYFDLATEDDTGRRTTHIARAGLVVVGSLIDWG